MYMHDDVQEHTNKEGVDRGSKEQALSSSVKRGTKRRDGGQVYSRFREPKKCQSVKESISDNEGEGSLRLDDEDLEGLFQSVKVYSSSIDNLKSLEFMEKAKKWKEASAKESYKGTPWPGSRELREDSGNLNSFGTHEFMSVPEAGSTESFKEFSAKEKLIRVLEKLGIPDAEVAASMPVSKLMTQVEKFKDTWKKDLRSRKCSDRLFLLAKSLGIKGDIVSMPASEFSALLPKFKAQFSSANPYTPEKREKPTLIPQTESKASSHSTMLEMIAQRLKNLEERGVSNQEQLEADRLKQRIKNLEKELEEKDSKCEQKYSLKIQRLEEKNAEIGRNLAEITQEKDSALQQLITQLKIIEEVEDRLLKIEYDESELRDVKSERDHWKRTSQVHEKNLRKAVEEITVLEGYRQNYFAQLKTQDSKIQKLENEKNWLSSQLGVCKKEIDNIKGKHVGSTSKAANRLTIESPEDTNTNRGSSRISTTSAKAANSNNVADSLDTSKTIEREVRLGASKIKQKNENSSGNNGLTKGLGHSREGTRIPLKVLPPKEDPIDEAGSSSKFNHLAAEAILKGTTQRKSATNIQGTQLIPKTPAFTPISAQSKQDKAISSNDTGRAVYAESPEYRGIPVDTPCNRVINTSDLDESPFRMKIGRGGSKGGSHGRSKSFDSNQESLEKTTRIPQRYSIAMTDLDSQSPCVNLNNWNSLLEGCRLQKRAVEAKQLQSSRDADEPDTPTSRHMSYKSGKSGKSRLSVSYLAALSKKSNKNTAEKGRDDSFDTKGSNSRRCETELFESELLSPKVVLNKKKGRKAKGSDSSRQEFSITGADLTAHRMGDSPLLQMSPERSKNLTQSFKIKKQKVPEDSTVQQSSPLEILMKNRAIKKQHEIKKDYLSRTIDPSTSHARKLHRSPSREVSADDR